MHPENDTLDISFERFPYLRDHRVRGMYVVPGALLVDMALQAAREALGRPAVLEHIAFLRMLLLPEQGGLSVRVRLQVADDGASRLFIEDASSASPYFSATVAPESHGPTGDIPLTPIRNRCSREESAADWYERLAGYANEYGPAFQTLQTLWLGEAEALAAVRAPAASCKSAPVVLDAAAQTVLAAADRRDTSQTCLLAGIDEVHWYTDPPDACFAHAELLPNAALLGDALIGDVHLLDAQGRALADMLGVRFRPVPDAERERTPWQLVVAGTFTAEPLRASLEFWTRKLEDPARVVFAPYNQLFQQLADPTSLLSHNADGANVLLVRPEDWLPSAPEGLDTGTRYRLPNGMHVVHLNAYETDYLYDEIFVDRSYMADGIELQPGDVVFDVGANIGLFTLFVQQECPTAKLYAFEPSPAAFDAMESNCRSYAPAARRFKIGLADRDGSAAFTWYPRSSVFSGFYAEADADRPVLETVVRNLLRARLGDSPLAVDEVAHHLVEDRLESQTFECEVRTLSSIMHECEVGHIDLLKIDAEKSELAVLAGIADEDWPLIRQVVMEVHGSHVEHIQQLLQERGFAVSVHDAPLLEGSGMHTLTGRRTPAREQLPMPERPATNTDDAVDDLVAGVLAGARRSSSPYVVCLCPASPSTERDPRRSTVVKRAEERLVAGLSGVDGVYVLTPDDVLRRYPVRAVHDTYGEGLGHIPYTMDYFAALGTSIARLLHAVRRRPFKVIVLDCDQTLWQGICGEDGPQGVSVDAPRRHLQEFMLTQRARGMLLCLCSRNNRDDVVATFEAHPSMPLRLEDFVATRVNWAPKSANVLDLAHDLNVGLDSMIVVEDDPLERGELEANCPGTVVLGIPDRPEDIPEFLDHVWAFDQVGTATAEDVRRSEFYEQDAQRAVVREHAPTFAAFLASLDLHVSIRNAEAGQLQRVAQLSRRTSQFTLNGRPYTETELQSRAAGECLAVEVRDRFGDYGLVGAIGLHRRAAALVIDLLVLSCRALGRGVEHRMLAAVGQRALEQRIEWVELESVATGRNQPLLDFVDEVKMRTADAAAAAVVRLSASKLASLTFEPPTTAPPSTPAGQSQSLTATRASLFWEIATELRVAPRIVAAIEASQRRARPNGATAVMTPPATDLERTISSVWQEVLGVEEIGVDDNFFELGGTSLAAVLVMSELKRRLDVEVSTIDVFAGTTISSLADLLRHEGDRDVEAELAQRRARGAARRASHLARRRT